jgi:hypothetical protein
MIACPGQKVEASPGWKADEVMESINRGENGPAQGLVSWGNCIKCRFNKGFDENKLTIKCGFGGKVVELESMPL